MPRGIPAAGRRAPRGSKNQAATVEVFETDAEINARIAERFEALEELTDAAVNGNARALIVSGPAGLGKSFTVDRIINENLDESNFTVISGFVRATGLRRALWDFRNKDQVIVFDDSDSIFFDDVSLNLLKAACDSTKKRMISWMTEGAQEGGDGDIIPRSFEFKGTIIFITNYDFDAMIEKGHRLSNHFLAMTSRAHYIDLSIKTKRDYLMRVRQVIEAGMLRDLGYGADVEADVLNFFTNNLDSLRELSLRMAQKLAMLRKSNPAKFDRMARITCCRQV